MSSHDGGSDGIFDARVAPFYDATLGVQGTAEVVDAIVDVLVDLADGGPVLELAVGTGRIALPLAARGVEVHGIELSTAMVRELRNKPEGQALPVVIGESRHVWVQGGRATTFDTPMRYAFPAELDLTAQLAGMHPVERWGDWHRSPFTAQSTSHVSVWKRPSEG